MNARLKKVLEAVNKASREAKVHPQELTQSVLFEHNEDLTAQDLRVLGGFKSVINSNFPFTDKELGTIVKTKETNKYIKVLEQQAGSVEAFKDNIIDAIKKGISELDIKKVKVSKPKSNKLKKMTMELMLSDIHYGKKSDTFNYSVCRKRMKDLCNIFLREIELNSKMFNVERIVIALLGDIIESYQMHGLESALGCEFNTPKQMQCAIESLFQDVLVPICKTGIKIDVVAVTGNHDRTEHNRTYNKPGENNVTWVIYNTLNLLCDAYGLKNVKFHIPENSYQILDIYGNNCLYEHGDNIKANNRIGYIKLMSDRAQQVGKVLHFGRFGHWHEYACYDRGRIIVNESVCGQDSYANVKGFTTSQGQTINYYIETNERPTCFYKSFPVYLN